jgi:ATP-binding cassette subfamily C protein
LGPRGASEDADAGLVAFARAFLAFARWRAAVAAVLVALGAVFEGIGLLLLVPLLGLVLAPGRDLDGPLMSRLAPLLGRFDQTQRLLVLLAAFAALMAVRSLVLSWRDRRLNALQMAFVESIRMRLVRRIADARWRDVVGVSQARMTQALSVEIHQIGIAAHSALLAVTALAMLVGLGVLALTLTPLGGAVAFGFAGLAALASRPFLTRARILGRSITDAHFGMAEGASAFLGGLKLARAERLQETFVAEYRRASGAAIRDRLDFAGQQTALRGVAAGLAAAIGAAVLVAGVAWLHLPAPVLLALLLVLARMSGPAQLAQQGVQQVLHSLPAYAVVRALERSLSDAAVDDPAPSPPCAVGEAVVLRRVTYRPPGAAMPLLEGQSLVIPAGAFVGLVGPSGVGKTTFLDLVAGLLVPETGRLAVGEGRGERLAYVAQEAFLFDGSVRRNLAWGCPDATETEMVEALALAEAGDLLARLGLDGAVGDRGARVSAGERQRLALARAVLRRPGLLILDEATNALDVATERAILARLDQLRPATTILMVSHRAESLALCDHLLTFPDLRLRRRAPAVMAG